MHAAVVVLAGTAALGERRGHPRRGVVGGPGPRAGGRGRLRRPRRGGPPVGRTGGPGARLGDGRPDPGRGRRPPPGVDVVVAAGGGRPLPIPGGSGGSATSTTWATASTATGSTSWSAGPIPPTGAPGARLHPRGRLGDRRQAGAGHPDDARAGGAGLGLRGHQLPAQPQGHLAGPHRRLQAGHRLGPRPHRRVRRRPLVRRRVRGIGRRAPVGPGRPDRRRPRVAARLRGRRHLGRRLHPLLRRPRHDRRLRGRAGPTGTGSWSSSSGGDEGHLRRQPAVFEQASPDQPDHPGGAAHVRGPGDERHPGAAPGGPALRGAAARRRRPPRWPTWSCPGPSTPSTSWSRSGPATPPSGRSASWRGSGAAATRGTVPAPPTAPGADGTEPCRDGAAGPAGIARKPGRRLDTRPSF